MEYKISCTVSTHRHLSGDLRSCLRNKHHPYLSTPGKLRHKEPLDKKSKAVSQPTGTETHSAIYKDCERHTDPYLAYPIEVGSQLIHSETQTIQSI